MARSEHSQREEMSSSAAAEEDKKTQAFQGGVFVNPCHNYK